MRALPDGAVQEIIHKGGNAIAVQADVGIEPDVVRMFRHVDQTLGLLTALVNNAGIVEQQSRLEAMDSIRLQRIFTTNVTGSVLCAREAVRRMSTRTGGKGGSKAAIDTMTVGLAKEVAPEGIRVKCRPSWHSQNRHPCQRR